MEASPDPSSVPLSVIMPSYNEGDGLLLALDEVQEAVRGIPGTEIVVVDDGSTDDTAALLARRSVSMPSLVVLRQENAGHGQALLNGISQARGEVFLLLDSDRQIALDLFPAHWRQLNDTPLDAILGIRSPRHDPAIRLLITRAMRLLILLRFGQRPMDAGVPYKLVRRSAWEVLKPLIPAQSVVPSVLLAILLLVFRPGRVVEVKVPHRPRVTGESVLRWARLYRLCRSAAGDVLSLSRNVARARKSELFAGCASDANANDMNKG